MATATKDLEHIVVRVTKEVKEDYYSYLLLKGGVTIQADLEEYIRSRIAEMKDAMSKTKTGGK